MIDAKKSSERDLDAIISSTHIDDSQRNASIKTPRLISLQGFCFLFDECATRSVLTSKSKNFEKDIAQLRAEISELKKQDTSLQENIDYSEKEAANAL